MSDLPPSDRLPLTIFYVLIALVVAAWLFVDVVEPLVWK